MWGAKVAAARCEHSSRQTSQRREEANWPEMFAQVGAHRFSVFSKIAETVKLLIVCELQLRSTRVSPSAADGSKMTCVRAWLRLVPGPRGRRLGAITTHARSPASLQDGAHTTEDLRAGSGEGSKDTRPHTHRTHARPRSLSP